jgi:ankyrin repeat protein
VPEDPSLYNPLMIAAKYGHVEATSMLIAAGIDVNHRDPEVHQHASR